MKTQRDKIKHDRVLTASVGSYPKPAHLFDGSGRELLDEVGMTFHEAEQEIDEAEFKNRLHDATMMAINDQDEAEIDIVSDGEESRGHYVLSVLRKLDGIDFEHLQQKSIREGHYIRLLPVVIGKITYRKPITVDDYEFAAKHAKGVAKMSLPGPATVVDTVVDEYYEGDYEQLAMDYAQAIRHEVDNLIRAGCQVIQFDDPALLRYPQQARTWGLRTLYACFEGFENQATYIVHICRGYPDEDLDKQKASYKADTNNYEGILKLLSESTIDIVSIEAAPSVTEHHGDLDLSILPAIGDKRVMLGVVDVGSNDVESVEYLVEKGKEALKYLPKEQLILAPNCGMALLSRTASRRKLANISAAASILNKQ